jgi:hypothetical protein
MKEMKMVILSNGSDCEETSKIAGELMQIFINATSWRCESDVSQKKENEIVVVIEPRDYAFYWRLNTNEIQYHHVMINKDGTIARNENGRIKMLRL